MVQEARREEQHGNLSGAIELYRKALRLQENEDDPGDPTLYNQLGDLYMRSGVADKGVACYLKALDGLEEQGLHRAAIALCKKVLRNAPDRGDICRRTARLQARAGLLAEARESYIEVADRMERAGDTERALEVLSEFVQLSDDEEIRLALADRYVVAGRPELALEELREVRRCRVEQGRDSDEITRRIAEIEPEVDAEHSSGPVETAPRGGGGDAEWKPTAAAANGSVPGEAEPGEPDLSGLAAELQTLLGRSDGADRLRMALPVIDRLLELEPHQIDLLQRKMNYALALGDEARVVEAYGQLGEALETRVAGFELRAARPGWENGSPRRAIEAGARPAAANGRG